jgi:hypothetical protein
LVQNRLTILSKFDQPPDRRRHLTLVFARLLKFEMRLDRLELIDDSQIQAARGLRCSTPFRGTWRVKVLHTEWQYVHEQNNGLLVRRHVIAGEFHYIGKEASTRWGSGPDLSMMDEAGILDPTHETFREYERVVDPKYLEQIRSEAQQFSTKRLSRQSRLAACAIRNFKNGKNTIKPRSLRKLTRAIHDLQNKNLN